jgi:hypothetical protein
MNSGSQYSSYQNDASGAGSDLTDAVVETMVRWPMRVTGATMDLMLQGMQRMTGAGSSSSTGSGRSSSSDSTSGSSSSTGSSFGSGLTSLFTGSNNTFIDQDLSGDDLKYVIWSIVFTKPGQECILQKQQEELVNYSADSNTYAALKIARFLDSARHGHASSPEGWSEREYASDSSRTKGSSRRAESTTVITTPASTTVASSVSGSAAPGAQDQGWRIPTEDQKYIVFLYKVDRRIPRQEEVTRVERVTVERGTRVV